ncbi:MAG TPA: acylneuraminate cytidylyltransferase family protein [Smithellaceae bacterium]|nr:acylneuraminate cytidylyltransferase family protein [Smithellaceae bacterium]
MIKIVAVITARGGSKAIPGKNIKPFAGKPLIAWTIEVAQACGELDRVIVSTDDEKIAAVSRQWGAEVPFLRPAELSKDDSSHISVILHALNWLEATGYYPDYVMLLQPTSPFRTVADLKRAIRMAEEYKAKAVVSVRETHHHPYLCKRLMDNGILADFVSTEIGYLRRQDLPKAYALNGAIYLNKPDSLLKDQTFLPEGTFAYVMPEERSIDVDTPWDWYIGELIIKDHQEHDQNSK